MNRIYTDYQMLALIKSQLEAIRDHAMLATTPADRAYIRGQWVALCRIATACSLDQKELDSLMVEIELILSET